MRAHWMALAALLAGCPGPPDELCNGVDDDGDGQIDEDAIDVVPLFADGDGDGYGAAAVGEGCPTSTLVAAGGDCDDTEAEVAPGAEELCNGVDDDCDGTLPDDELDADADGWLACGQDCDDTDAEIGPDRSERCNGIDDNCDDLIPPDEADDDGDGARICDGDCDDNDPTARPGQPEDCDHVDDDCDGRLDWGIWVPEHYANPQLALDDAPPGSTVCVAEGDWFGPFEGTRGVSLVGEDRDGTVLTTSVRGSTTLTMSGSAESAVTGLTVTHGIPGTLAKLVDVRGPVAVSEITLAGPACTDECLVLAGKVDASGDAPPWEDVLVRDLTWTGSERAPLGPGLQVEGPLTLRRMRFERLAIRPSACGAYVRGAAVVGPRAVIEDMSIEGVDIDLADCELPGVIQVEGGLVFLSPSVQGLTVRDVNVRLLESPGLDLVSVRGLVARLSSGEHADLDVEGVSVTLGGNPLSTGMLFAVDGTVDGLRVVDVDIDAGGGLMGVVAAASEVAITDLHVEGVHHTRGGADGLVLAALPTGGGEVSVEGGLLRDISGAGPAVFAAPNARDVTLRQVEVEDVDTTGLLEVFSTGQLTISGLYVRGGSLGGPAVELWGGTGTFDYVDIRGTDVASAPLVRSTVPIDGSHWVLAGNTVSGTAAGALVDARSSLDLSFATLHGNTVAEALGGPGAVLVEAAGGDVDHLDLSGTRGSDALPLVSGLDSASYVNRWDNVPDAMTVGASDNDLAVDPGYVDAAGGDPAAWDLHLAPTSPLVDAGDPACTDDDASVCDVSAYGGAAWP